MYTVGYYKAKYRVNCMIIVADALYFVNLFQKICV